MCVLPHLINRGCVIINDLISVLSYATFRWNQNFFNSSSTTREMLKSLSHHLSCSLFMIDFTLYSSICLNLAITYNLSTCLLFILHHFISCEKIYFVESSRAGSIWCFCFWAVFLRKSNGFVVLQIWLHFR